MKTTCRKCHGEFETGLEEEEGVIVPAMVYCPRCLIKFKEWLREEDNRVKTFEETDVVKMVEEDERVSAKNYFTRTKEVTPLQGESLDWRRNRVHLY